MRKDKTQSKRTAFFAEMKRIKSVLKKENVPSSAKIIAVMSSKALDETFSKGSISQKYWNCNMFFKSGGRTPSANANALAGTFETNGRSSTSNSVAQKS